MRTIYSWFSFETRCLLCGWKFDPQKSGSIGLNRHLDLHKREGYLNGDLDQIKPHPHGFPGPPLGLRPPAKPKDLNGPKRADFATFDDWCAARVKWAEDNIQCSTQPSPA